MCPASSKDDGRLPSVIVSYVRHWGISLVFALVAVAACVGESPDTNGTTPSGNDGGTSSSGGSSGTNLADNGGFENGCPSGTSSADITTEIQIVNTGAKACKVCSKGTEAGYILELTVDVQAKKGDVYRVSASMRKAPDVAAGNGSLVSVIAIDSGGSPIERSPGIPEGASTPGPQVSDTGYKEAGADWTVGSDGVSRVRIDVGHQGGAAGECFLVDDVSLTKKN